MIILPEVSDITYFVSDSENLGRSSNDHNNKVRENIITCMPHIDDDYFLEPTHGESWIKIKFDFDSKMRLICPNYTSYKIQHKAGRGYNYDYIISFFDESKQKIADEKLEFKYNASTIDETPQFVSPMKPSQYLSQSFEEYYYDNYLVTLLKQFELEDPERNIYLKSVHNNKPKCMESAQLLYYQGCKQSSKYTGEEQAIKFYQSCNDTSRECIKNFINNTELNIDKLNQYLMNSQDKKNYLLYKNGEFHIQPSNNDDYTIVRIFTFTCL